MLASNAHALRVALIEPFVHSAKLWNQLPTSYFHSSVRYRVIQTAHEYLCKFVKVYEDKIVGTIRSMFSKIIITDKSITVFFLNGICDVFGLNLFLKNLVLFGSKISLLRSNRTQYDFCIIPQPIKSLQSNPGIQFL